MYYLINKFTNKLFTIAPNILYKHTHYHSQSIIQNDKHNLK